MRLLFAIFFLTISSISYGQNTKRTPNPNYRVISSDMASQMRQLLPDAIVVDNRVQGNVSEVIFSRNGRTGTISFNNEGQWVKLAEPMATCDIQPTTLEVVSGLYPTSSITTAYKVQTPGSGVFYDITVEGPSGTNKLLLTDKGEVVVNVLSEATDYDSFDY